MANPASGRIALLSIRPQYAEAIMAGDKRVEFRKTALRPDVEQALVYSTSPVQRFVGAFSIQRIDTATPEELWARYSEVGCISEAAFDAYYAAHAVGAAIVIAEAWRLPSPLVLTQLHTDLRAPQSYRYIEADLLRLAGLVGSRGGAAKGGQPDGHGRAGTAVG